MKRIVFKTFWSKAKRIIKDLPFVWSIYRLYTEIKIGMLHKNKQVGEIFTNINTTNLWNNQETISGPGSTVYATSHITSALPEFLKKHKIQSILDAPCGDFHWMQNVDLSTFNYTGADIVNQLVKSNNEKYKAENIEFIHLDIIKDTLPSADLILVRDCLVHFNDINIFKFFQNLCNSDIIYLLTTNFPLTMHNYNITNGNWRPLNLMRKPYSLPKEVDILWEESVENDGQFPDKSLYLWKVVDLKSLFSLSD